MNITYQFNFARTRYSSLSVFLIIHFLAGVKTPILNDEAIDNTQVSKDLYIYKGGHRGGGSRPPPEILRLKMFSI